MAVYLAMERKGRMESRKIMSDIKRISIFTDASFKAETRIAGTGVVIVDNNKTVAVRKFRTHGVLNIAHAELIGVLNGFEVLLDFFVNKKYKGKIAISFFIDNIEIYRTIQTYYSKDDVDELNRDLFFKQTLLRIFSFMDDERFEIEYVFIGGKAKKLYKEHVRADILSKSKKSSKKCPKSDKAELDRRKAESQRAKAKNKYLIDRATK